MKYRLTQERIDYLHWIQNFYNIKVMSKTIDKALKLAKAYTIWSQNQIKKIDEEKKKLLEL